MMNRRTAHPGHQQRREHVELLSRVQRQMSWATGACLVATGAIRRTLGGAALAAIGSYFLYRGFSGRCPLSGWLLGRVGGRGRAAVSLEGDEFRRTTGKWVEEGSLRAPHPVEWNPPRDMDAVDEASLESFPASDSPGFTGAAASRSALTGDRDTQESPPSHVR